MYVVGCLLGSDPCTCMYLLKRVMGGRGGAFTVYCTYMCLEYMRLSHFAFESPNTTSLSHGYLFYSPSRQRCDRGVSGTITHVPLFPSSTYLRTSRTYVHHLLHTYTYAVGYRSVQCTYVRTCISASVLQHRQCR